MSFFGIFEQLKIHFVFDDFQQGNIARTQASRIRQERPALTAAGGQLSNATGDQIHQNVGISNFRQCLFYKFAVQSSLMFNFSEPVNLLATALNAIVNLIVVA